MYRYTDKEAQNDLNQNLLDFGWRQYDPVIARWHVTDPAEQFYNPYLAIGANPVSLIDPDGRKTHSGMSSNSTKPFDLPLASPDLNNGFGGGGAVGYSLGRGSLASLNPYDMQQLQLASGTAIASEYKNGNMHMSAGTYGQTRNNGALVLTNTSSGAAFSVINGANTNYGVVNGQVVNLNLTQPITETYDYSYGQVTETFNNYISVQQDGMYVFQSNFPQKDFLALNNAERTAHILNAIRYANVNKYYAFNINQIFSNFDKNSSHMMSQGFSSGTVTLQFGERVMDVYVDFSILGNLAGNYNPLVTVEGGQPFDRNIRGDNWRFYSRPGFQWGTTRENFDYLYNWLGY